MAGDTMATPADEDPWRDACDDHDGATLHGASFGALVDHHDVLHARDPCRQKPYEILAISEPLEPGAAGLLGAAVGGRTELWHRIEDDGLTPRGVVAFGTEAIRVALYRRSSILRLVPDPWAEAVFLRWACLGKPSRESRIARTSARPGRERGGCSHPWPLRSSVPPSASSTHASLATTRTSGASAGSSDGDGPYGHGHDATVAENDALNGKAPRYHPLTAVVIEPRIGDGVQVAHEDLDPA